MKTVLLLCVLCFILFGCESKTDEQKAEKLEKSNQFLEDFMSRSHKEKVELLSLKYDIEKTKPSVSIMLRHLPYDKLE